MNEIDFLRRNVTAAAMKKGADPLIASEEAANAVAAFQNRSQPRRASDLADDYVERAVARTKAIRASQSRFLG